MLKAPVAIRNVLGNLTRMVPPPSDTSLRSPQSPGSAEARRPSVWVGRRLGQVWWRGARPLLSPRATPRLSSHRLAHAAKHQAGQVTTDTAQQGASTVSSAPSWPWSRTGPSGTLSLTPAGEAGGPCCQLCIALRGSEANQGCSRMARPRNIPRFTINSRCTLVQRC